MKALVWDTTEQILTLSDIEEPQIQGADEIKLQVLSVGICGTDREEVHSDHVLPPKEKKTIVLGHEMLGRVVEIGPLVTHVKPGDLATFTVRRGCMQCPACDLDAADMCYTDQYTERGIRGEDGFQSEYVVDREKYVIKVPQELASTGVLCEPMSVIQKVITEVAFIQKNRLPNWAKEENCFEQRRVLVAGIGTIGLLAAIAFRLRGAEVWGYDLVEPTSIRPTLLQKIGGNYISAKEVPADQLRGRLRHVDVIFEAAGQAQLCFDLLSALGANGVYAMTGIVIEKHKQVTLDGAAAMLDIVLKNQVVLGSVNANHDHWQLAINDLQKAQKKWRGLLEQLITKEYLIKDFKTPFYTQEQSEIKSVIRWADGGL